MMTTEQQQKRKEKEGSCVDCGDETDLRGWIYATPEGEAFSLDTLVREYRWYCKPHFLTHMFNLLPFTCTEACHEQQGAVNGIVLPGDAAIVWLPLSVAMSPVEPVTEGRSVPLKPRAPSCPWCNKAMQIAGKPFG